MGQESCQTDGDGVCVRMELVELHLTQALLLEQQASWQAQHILGEAGRAEGGERFTAKHPLGRPGEQVMRYVGQQDQSLLRSQLFLAAAFEFQAALVGLDFSLTRTAIIVVCDDFGECPSQHGADDRAILGLAVTGLPPQDQMLGRAHVGDGGAGWGYPAPMAQILPVLGGDLLRIRLRPPPAFTFAQYLPSGGQRMVDIGVAAEARI